jgi:hypothetical protein
VVTARPSRRAAGVSTAPRHRGAEGCSSRCPAASMVEEDDAYLEYAACGRAERAGKTTATGRRPARSRIMRRAERTHERTQPSRECACEPAAVVSSASGPSLSLRNGVGSQARCPRT